MVAYQSMGVRAAACTGNISAYAQKKLLYVAVGETSRPPIGWVQFCEARPWECKVERMEPRDVQFTAQARRELERVNRFVNERIKPLTDLEHYGVIEKWTYPEDGYGDCEDYVLLKRHELKRRGWPASALLVTVVRDEEGEGHAVLTVRTDRGELVLDNKVDVIRPWYETNYTYVKRQATVDAGRWLRIDDRADLPVSSIRR